ncbi:ABC transporter permease [Diaphorobacter sp.]|uniref:ABC transporter permease n=1 Tax=Diaphorobacter sp. TaxID=1934310 RepID=UPI0028A5941B|nr:ABC transporter permease [Diaphorobacter sp.]
MKTTAMSVDGARKSKLLERENPWLEAIRMFARNKSAVLALIVLAIVVVGSLLMPYIYPADPFEIAAAPMTPPFSEDAWLGTDFLGRDVLRMLLHGGRVTILVGAVAAALSITIGIIVGALSGFYEGRWISTVLSKVTEFFQVLPALLFAMVVTSLFTPSLVTVTIAIGIVSWTATARLTRAEFLKLRNIDFVRAERAIGAKNGRIIWQVILPNALPPLVVSATLAIGSAILFEAGLSFLGLGDPNEMSWGLMIGSSRTYILSNWWAVTFPGLAIFLVVLSISLIGDGLNDAFNPKLRER